MSTWAEQATLELVLEALERIEKLLERASAAPLPVLPFDPNRCAMCGGYHGPNVICPRLQPTGVTPLVSTERQGRMEKGREGT